MAGVVVVVAVKPQLLADGTAQLLFITGETVPAVYHAHALTSYHTQMHSAQEQRQTSTGRVHIHMVYIYIA